jgi:HAD superfamily hydrolase (TIGR02253 family)
MIKAVVFDLDNTLVDFMKMKRSSIDAAVYAMIDAGLNLSYEEIKNGIEKIYDEKGIEYQLVFDQLLLDYAGKIDHKILSAGIVSYRKEREANLIPYPHVTLTLIKLIKMGIKLGIVSDAPAKEAWLRLSFLNLQHLFDHIITFEDTGERKPSPLPFKKILGLLNVNPEESIMVGDWAERDMVGAGKVGMKTAFARYGDAFATKTTNADYELNDIIELLDIVKKENGI